MGRLKEKLIELGYTISQEANLAFTAAKIDFNDGNELVIKVRGNIIIEAYIFSLTRWFRRKKTTRQLTTSIQPITTRLGGAKGI